MSESLREIEEVLRGRFPSAAIRGDGRSAFLLIEHAGKSVELSWDGPTGWWIEGWDQPEDDARSTAEWHAASAEEAVQTVEEWLIDR